MHRTLKIEDLVGFFEHYVGKGKGERLAVLLCRYFSYHKIPSPEKLLKYKRDQAIWRDWYDNGATYGELSAKYNLAEAVIKRKLTIRIRELREEKNA